VTSSFMAPQSSTREQSTGSSLLLRKAKLSTFKLGWY
jgi:hypothetical protein